MEDKSSSCDVLTSAQTPPPRKSEKPDFVPDTGWFFILRPRTSDSQVWCDGRLVPCITKVMIEVDANGNLPRAQVEILAPNVRCELPDENVKILEKIREEDTSVKDPDTIF